MQICKTNNKKKIIQILFFYCTLELCCVLFSFSYIYTLFFTVYFCYTKTSHVYGFYVYYTIYHSSSCYTVLLCAFPYVGCSIKFTHHLHKFAIHPSRYVSVDLVICRNEEEQQQQQKQCETLCA
jgi:hypothetical protein